MGNWECKISRSLGSLRFLECGGSGSLGPPYPQKYVESASCWQALRGLGHHFTLNLIPRWLRDVGALVRASGLLFADFLPAAWHVASVKPQGALCRGVG